MCHSVTSGCSDHYVIGVVRACRALPEPVAVTAIRRSATTPKELHAELLSGVIRCRTIGTTREIELSETIRGTKPTGTTGATRIPFRDTVVNGTTYGRENHESTSGTTLSVNPMTVTNPAATFEVGGDSTRAPPTELVVRRRIVSIRAAPRVRRPRPETPTMEVSAGSHRETGIAGRLGGQRGSHHRHGDTEQNEPHEEVQYGGERGGDERDRRYGSRRGNSSQRRAAADDRKRVKKRASFFRRRDARRTRLQNNIAK
ncbi:hypothetical protein [Haladaptatus halobius]|uniref:hypothetical protein n=1 Tax=Haladaptatus halobius TaxID=2884875 RepID=UPI001D0B229F|nr:hypothetical protein [Haladaptatus halobius]